MTIRNRTAKTLEVSSLSNRGVRSPPRMSACIRIYPKRVALSE